MIQILEDHWAYVTFFKPLEWYLRNTGSHNSSSKSVSVKCTLREASCLVFCYYGALLKSAAAQQPGEIVCVNYTLHTK